MQTAMLSGREEAARVHAVAGCWMMWCTQVFTVTVPGEAEEVAAVRKLVASLAPGSRRTYALGGTQKFELPCDEVSLSQVLSPPPFPSLHACLPLVFTW